MAGTGYIKSLDGVRAIAILLVMTFHARLTNFGWIGVQLFFVLSGFLITGILWKEKSNPAPLGFKFKKFWVRRSLRIFPLYYGYVGIIAILWLIARFPVYFPLFFPYIATYTANFPLALLHEYGNPLFNHLWSLSIEEQFYLLFPLIILLSPKRLIKILLIAIVLFSPLLRFIVGEHYKSLGHSALTVSDAVNFNTLCQLDAFCLGGLIPVLNLDSRLKRPWTMFAVAAGICVAAGILNYSTTIHQAGFVFDWGYYHYGVSHYEYVWQYSCLNFVFAALLLALVSDYGRHRFPRFTGFLENKWMVRMGKVSYGMYIFHWLVYIYLFYGLFKPTDRSTIALLLIPYVLVVYGLSELSYRFFEARFIQWKDRFFPASARSEKKTELPITQQLP
jgi:peptidoglycan/LPS O-acetylase OafA/YrhL